jgi:hypothetical protein
MSGGSPSQGQRLGFTLLGMGVLFCAYMEYDLTVRLNALELVSQQRRAQAAEQPTDQPVRGEGPPPDHRGSRRVRAGGGSPTDMGAGEPSRPQARHTGRDLATVLERRIRDFAQAQDLDEDTTETLTAEVRTRRAALEALEAAHRDGELSAEDLTEHRADHRQALEAFLVELLGEEKAGSLWKEMFPGRSGRGSGGEPQ